MNYKNIVLNNGIKIKTCLMPNTHSVTLLMRIKGGVSRESHNQNGLTHLVEHLCFRRCAGIEQKKFYYIIDSLGAYLRGTTFREYIIFEITVSPNHLMDAVEILKLLFEDNKWTHTDLRREKEVVYRQIEATGNWEYKRMIYDYFDAMSYGSSIMGTKSKVRKMSLNQIELWKKDLFRSSSTDIVIAGNVSENELQALERRISKIPYKENLQLPEIKPKRFMCRSNADDKMYTENVEYIQICLAFDIDIKNMSLPALNVLRDYMCTEMLSPLNLRLREELGLIHDFMSNIERFSFGGLWYFIFDVHESKAIQLLDEIGTVFSEQKNCIDNKIFECAKCSQIDGKSYLHDTPSELAYLLLESKINTPDDLFNEITEVKTGNVQALANEIFVSGNLSITLYNVPKDELLYLKLPLEIEKIRNKLEMNI